VPLFLAKATAPQNVCARPWSTSLRVTENKLHFCTCNCFRPFIITSTLYINTHTRVHNLPFVKTRKFEHFFILLCIKKLSHFFFHEILQVKWKRCLFYFILLYPADRNTNQEFFEGFFFFCTKVPDTLQLWPGLLKLSMDGLDQYLDGRLIMRIKLLLEVRPKVCVCVCLLMLQRWGWYSTLWKGTIFWMRI